jgi:hypothetical protein
MRRRNGDVDVGEQAGRTGTTERGADRHSFRRVTGFHRNTIV